MPEDRRLVPEFTVEDNIRLPSWMLAIDGVEKRIEWIFALVRELLDLRDRRALELSGGQQKMAALARVLMAGRRILLLVEPFEGLAPALARRLAAVLADLKSAGLSILIAESNQIHVAKLLSQAYRIERSQVAPAWRRLERCPLPGSARYFVFSPSRLAATRKATRVRPLRDARRVSVP